MTKQVADKRGRRWTTRRTTRMLAPAEVGRGAGAALATLAVALGGCGVDRGGSDAPELAVGDTAAVYAARLIGALGGRQAWDRTRYVSFRWVVEREGAVVADREHSWDRYDGRYRLAFDEGERSHLSLFDVDRLRDLPELGKTPEGRVWVDGVELTGAGADSALARAYRIFINDTYWLLMPFKWDDPGVHLGWEGMRRLEDGREYATVHLTFDRGLGVTEDQYWGFVDPETGRMAAWQYHLGRSEAPGDVIWWEDWTEVGGVRFAMSRRSEPDGPRVIYFEDVVAAPRVPDGRFDPPTP